MRGLIFTSVLLIQTGCFYGFLIDPDNTAAATCVDNIIHIKLKSNDRIYNISHIQWAVHAPEVWKYGTNMRTCTDSVCTLSDDHYSMDLLINMTGSHFETWAYAINHMRYWTIPEDFRTHPRIVTCLTASQVSAAALTASPTKPPIALPSTTEDPAAKPLNHRNQFKMWMSATCEKGGNLTVVVHLGNVSATKIHGVEYAYRSLSFFNSFHFISGMHVCDNDYCRIMGDNTVVIQKNVDLTGIALAVNVIGYVVFPLCQDFHRHPFLLACNGSSVDSRVEGPLEEMYSCPNKTTTKATTTTIATTHITTVKTGCKAIDCKLDCGIPPHYKQDDFGCPTCECQKVK